MSKTVRVAPGYSNVPLYSGVLNQGQTVVLTDDQFTQLPQFIQQQLQVVSSTPDTYAAVLSDSNFTSNLILSLLRKMGVALTLTWDGTQYQPQASVADMTRTKVFIGPTDPETIPGVLLNTRDQWIAEA